MSITPESAEGIVILAVKWIILGVEIFGAGLVALGVVLAISHLIRSFSSGRPPDFVETRLIPARFLALALEFQLGADILGTAISPDWDQIGKLAVVAAIRTGLNFFLSMELKREGGEPDKRAEVIDG